MLTVDFDRLGLRPGDRVLDLGCGAGRHAFEMYRRGADVVAFDQDADELSRVRDLFVAMKPRPARCPTGAEADVKEGDALSLPFADGEFDRVVAAEVLEHIPADIQALERAGPGAAARRHDRADRCRAGSPRSSAGSSPTTTTTTPGGHIRIYTDAELRRPRPSTPVWCTRASDYAHGLHSPYWWIKCAVGVDNDDHPLAKAYHQLLVWDIMKQPRPLQLGRARSLDPLIGKSLVVYFHKPA